MQGQCSKDKCLESATYACNCLVPPLYLCDKHFVKHTRIPGKHTSECLIIKLTKDQKLALFPKLLKINKYLQEFKQQIRKTTNNLVSSIQSETLRVFNNIKELQKLVHEVANSKNIQKNKYERIQNFPFERNEMDIGKVDEIVKSVAILYSFPESESELAKEHANKIDYAVKSGDDSPESCKKESVSYIISDSTFEYHPCEKICDDEW